MKIGQPMIEEYENLKAFLGKYPFTKEEREMIVGMWVGGFKSMFGCYREGFIEMMRRMNQLADGGSGSDSQAAGAEERGGTDG